MLSFRARSKCGGKPCFIACGATLIHKNYAITAAHCVSASSPSDITLTAGLHSQSSETETDTRQVLSVQQIYVHPQYETVQYTNDIAILKVSSSFTYTKYVQPACLPNSDPITNDQVIMIGWGAERTSGTITDTLKQAYTKIVGNCNKYWPQVQPEIQICAANHVSGDSVCQGDSGGPLLNQDNGQYVAIGVASYGYKCITMGASGYPNVFTRVFAHKAWIQNIIQEE